MSKFTWSPASGVPEAMRGERVDVIAKTGEQVNSAFSQNIKWNGVAFWREAVVVLPVVAPPPPKPTVFLDYQRNDLAAKLYVQMIGAEAGFDHSDANMFAADAINLADIFAAKVNQ